MISPRAARAVTPTPTIRIRVCGNSKCANGSTSFRRSQNRKFFYIYFSFFCPFFLFFQKGEIFCFGDFFKLTKIRRRESAHRRIFVSIKVADSTLNYNSITNKSNCN
jgi:hypothetical protein